MTDLPIVYEIDRAMHMVYAAVGPWTPEAIATWVEELLADPDYVPGMRGLLNLRFIAGPLPDVRMTQRIVDAMRPLTRLPARARWAVLVGSPVALIRLRLFETLTSDGRIHFRVFDDDAKASEWLGLEPLNTPWLRRL